jgi:hypothetical protein
MSKVVRVQGTEYKISVGSESIPGNIIFDTNPNADPELAQGSVIITGNLQVNGATTVIESQNLAISDRIIYLNEGETGQGVNSASPDDTKKFSGIQIRRGLLPDVSFVFDERFVEPTNELLTEPTWAFRTSSTNALLPIATNKIKSNNSLVLTIGQTGLVQIDDAVVNYESKILNYSLLSTSFEISTVSRTNNIATVITTSPHGLSVGSRIDINCLTDNSFSGSFIEVITSPTDTSFTYSSVGNNRSSTFVSGYVKPNSIAVNNSVPNMRAVADFVNSSIADSRSLTNNRIRENDTAVIVSDLDTSGVSKISFQIDGTERASVTSNGLTSGSIRIKNDTVFNINNDNILFDSVLNIPNRMSEPSTPIGYVKLYSKNVPATGGTGLFFKNTTGTNDELISKTKALLYSLIL